MNIVVLGASGRTGQWVTKVASERGHHVRAVARERSVAKVVAADEVITADVLLPEDVSRVVDDQDVVVSTLGLNRAGLNPWSRLLSPPDVVTRVVSALSARYAGPGSPRVIWMSAGGAGESLQAASFPIRRLIRAGNVGVAYRDLDAAEPVAAAAGFIAVRPVTLLNGASSRPAKPLKRYGLLSAVRRSAVARWIVEAAEAEGEPERPMLLG